MKKIFLVFIFLLFACSSNTSSSNYYDESYSENLAALINYVHDESDEEFSYANLKTYSSIIDEKVCLSLEFSKPIKDIKNFKVMVLPYSINKIENIPSSIVCIGYFNQNYTLSNEENVENYTFKGFRLSFLVNEKLKLEDNKLDLKFFFSGLIDNQEVGNKCYFISNDSIIDKNNK